MVCSEINVSMISGYVKYLVDNKVDGIYVTGTTGEGYSLTNDEKLSIAKAWLKAIKEQNANFLAIINVTSTCVKEALQLLKQLNFYQKLHTFKCHKVVT
jgi:N-acetylneuraminate lyase